MPSLEEDIDIDPVLKCRPSEKDLPAPSWFTNTARRVAIRQPVKPCRGGFLNQPIALETGAMR
jgi:hypothetical protein